MCRAALWLWLVPLIAAQPGAPGDQPVKLSAARHGRVQAKAGAVLLDADKGKLDAATGTLELRGHGRVTLPARGDRNLIRYAGRAVVTGDALVSAADRFSLKDGLLRGRGHVSVRTEQARLQADEVEVYLRLGDGELRGNIRVNGMPIELLDSRSRDERRRPRMPAEIIRN
jgi:lipopolysaccharide assembly outer membrane protein LptD (OstA)